MLMQIDSLFAPVLPPDKLKYFVASWRFVERLLAKIVDSVSALMKFYLVYRLGWVGLYLT
jgi:hypothetical protein